MSVPLKPFEPIEVPVATGWYRFNLYAGSAFFVLFAAAPFFLGTATSMKTILFSIVVLALGFGWIALHISLLRSNLGLLVDEAGIHERRFPAQTILWPEIEAIELVDGTIHFHLFEPNSLQRMKTGYDSALQHTYVAEPSDLCELLQLTLEAERERSRP